MPTSSSPSLLLPLPTTSPPATSSPVAPPTTTTNTPTSTPQTSAPTTSHPTTSPSTSPATTTSPTSSSPTTSASQFLTTSGGQALTVTSYVTPPATPTITTPNPTTSNSFFTNKGAVAGVFSVVGLIVVALIVALIVNAIRRRRAQKFDRDVAEAAAEAAMSSHSPFDEYNNGGNGRGGYSGGGGGYGYSDNSHGTYQQPPLPVHNSSYGMSEMSQYDPYAAGPPTIAAAAVGRGRSRNEGETGPAGFAGVGAGNLAREPSKRAPYHAFAGPVPQSPELRRNTLRSSRADVLEVAGLADTGPAMALNSSSNTDGFLARKPSEYTQNTHHSGRSQGNGSMSTHPVMLQPGYPVDSYYPQHNDTHSPESFVGHQRAQSGLPNPHDAALPSPSLPSHQSDHTFGDNEEYHDTGSPTALRSDEQRFSYQDEAGYNQGSRVLRVANE